MIADRFPASWANPFPHEANKEQPLLMVLLHIIWTETKKFMFIAITASYQKAWEILDEHVLGASKVKP
ncbi:MAG: hypothetical protein V8T87_01340 [Victivallales bacterium]